MTPHRALIVGAVYVGLGALGMAGWWLAARPAARGGAPASPLAAALLSVGAPSLDYPRDTVPGDLSGEPRLTWRSAHLDGWKWRLGQCLDGQPGGSPPNFFPPGDPARAAGFRAGWSAAHTQIETLVRDLGAPGATQFVRRRAREKPGLYDPTRAVPPPPE